jgi:uncharacterized membrane protein
MVRSLVVALSFVALTAGAAPAPSKAKLLDAENRAWATASPVLHKHCGECHIKGARLATRKRLNHFEFTSYPVGGHHADKIGVTVRGVLGLAGKKAIMPFGKAGSVTGADLAAIKAWTEAWDAADQAGAHAAAEPH